MEQAFALMRMGKKQAQDRAYIIMQQQQSAEERAVKMCDAKRIVHPVFWFVLAFDAI